MKRTFALAAAAIALLAVWTCDRPTPVAPSDGGLTISANPTQIDIDGLATITVIARKSDGNPVNEGTEVNFSTTLGRIDELVKTDSRGLARATLRGTGEVGTATVSASSGAAAAVSVDVEIGALAGSMTLSANPSTIPKEGGTINLVATVRDDRGNRLRNIGVNFDAEVGTLESGGSAVNTDSRGEARDVLTVTEFELRRVQDGLFVVTATTASAGGVELEETADITIGGFAATITLSVNPASITRDGGVLNLTALVRDDGGDPAQGAGVNFISELGLLASGGGILTTDSSGQVFDTLTVSPSEAESGGASFQVRVQTTGSAGSLLEDAATVSITGTVGGLQADFTFFGVGKNVTFTETSVGGQGNKNEWTFSWNYGDGTPSEEGTGTDGFRNRTHPYAATGDYLVTLTVRDTANEESVATKQVNIPKTPANAAFTFKSFATVFDGRVEFDGGTSTGQGDLSYSWEIEGGGPGAESNAEVFVYDFGTTTGEFQVTLTVTDEEDDVDTVTQFVNLDALN